MNNDFPWTNVSPEFIASVTEEAKQKYPGVASSEQLDALDGALNTVFTVDGCSVAESDSCTIREYVAVTMICRWSEDSTNGPRNAEEYRERVVALLMAEEGPIFGPLTAYHEEAYERSKRSKDPMFFGDSRADLAELEQRSKANAAEGRSVAA